MRILIISEAYPSERNPHSGIFVEKLARKLAERENDILVFSPRSYRSNLGLKPRTEGRVKVLYPSVPIPLTRTKRKSHFEISRSIAALICHRAAAVERFMPDVVYAHFALGSGAIASKVANRLLVPFVLMLGESSLGDNGHAEVLRNAQVEVIKSANRVMCVSQKLKRFAESVRGDQKVTHVPNGVDLTRFRVQDRDLHRKDFHLPQSAVVFGFVGTLSKRKGLVVLKNLQHKLGQAFRLAIASRSNIEGLSPVFCDFIENEKLPKFLASCDCFIFPTESEGMSNALLEAMACGLVIITSDTDFNREFLNEGNSILVDFSSPDEYLEVVRNIIRAPEEFRHIGAQAAKDVLRFDLNERARKVDEILQETTCSEK